MSRRSTITQLEAKIIPEKTKLKFDLKDYLVPIVVGVVVLLGIFVGLIPQIKDIMSINKEIDSLEKNRSSLEKKIEVLNSFSNSELNSMVASVEAALPSDKPIFQTLGMVQSRAVDYGLVVDGFEFSPGSIATESAVANKKTSNKSGSETMDLKTTLVGSFENLLQFIDAVENSGPISEVEGFSVSSADSFDNEIKTTMILKVYFMYPPSTISKISAPLKELSSEQLLAIENTKNFINIIPSGNFTPVSNTRENPFEY